MQFELTPPRDDDRDLGPMADEANWPGGFVALGEQLRDDANFLADRYPAGAPPALLLALADCLKEEPAAEMSGSDTNAIAPAPNEVLAPAKSAGWSVAWNALLPSVLAAVALAAVAVIVVPQWFPQDGGGSLANPGKKETNPTHVATIAPVPKPIETKAAEVVAPVDQSNPMTPALFEELSGPEREGLLDLLENQPQEKPRLSI